MVTIIDYGVGNLYSLKSSFDFIGQKIKVSGDINDIMIAEKLVLPGVGAFGDAAKKLSEKGMDLAVKEKAAAGIPVLGICLGMQLFFDYSTEYGIHKGLSLIDGCIEPIGNIIPEGLKIPHIGWNSLQFKKNHPVFRNITDGEYVYFVHSFYAKPKNLSDVAATCNYGADLTAAVAHKNIVGCQFHPEKSGKTGLNILKGFCEWDGEL